MCGTKRTEPQRIFDLKTITKLLRRGYTHQDIREHVNTQYKKDGISIELSRQQISYDIKQLIDEWLEDVGKDVNHIQHRMVEMIMESIKEAWEAWDRSIGTHKKMVTKLKTANKSTDDSFDESEIEEELAGDPRYLKIVQDGIDKICKIYGLYKFEPVKPTDNGLINELIDLLKPPAPPEQAKIEGKNDSITSI